MSAHSYPVYDYVPCAEQGGGGPHRHPVLVVGAGPVGLSAAIDLAAYGHRVVVLDAEDTVSVGSRAVCYSKRALEIWDRLGVARPMLDKGVGWQTGKVFFGDTLVHQFDLLGESGHRMPAFINLQQYYLEEFLVERARALGVELRWKNTVTEVTATAEGVRLTVDTPDGPYATECDWLIACDGAKGRVREALGHLPRGHVFQDRFLITDVVMKAELPAERRFWFDPPFNPGRSALMHRQPDDVWRLDFQLGWDADPEEERRPERAAERVRRMLGPGIDFSIEWITVYTYQCMRLDRFRLGRVLFAGDTAHQVSPFGARGANSGVQDTDNLVWKLDAVLRGRAAEDLIDSYEAERIPAAEENLLNSTRATDFIVPRDAASRALRDAVLSLARRHPFARRMINSGRLSLPHTYRDSPLSTADRDTFAGAMVPGAPCADAPLADGDWLLAHLGGRFVALVFAETPAPLPGLPDAVATVHVLPSGRDSAPGCITDTDGLAAARYDARPGTVYLIRPDQHVAGRWRGFDAAAVAAAHRRALGQGE